MIGTIVSVGFKTVVIGLAVVGLAGLALAWMIATPLRYDKPVTLFAGAADELMVPGRYKDAVGSRVPVRLIDGVNHMGIVSDPAAVSAIADDVAKAGSGS
jgi:hypothetical protein